MRRGPPNEEELNQITKWISEGVTEASVAAQFGLKYRSWYDRKRKYPQIQEAVDDGLKKDFELCYNLIRKRAFDDNRKDASANMFFYLKTRHHVSDRPDLSNNKEKVSSIKFPSITPETVENED